MQDRQPAHAIKPNGLGRAPRLLVIDDDLVQRTIISKIGQQVGYETQVASSFEDASIMLQHCAETGARDACDPNAYDCITLDLSLGERSGTQLLRSIAEAGKIPVIVISGCEERVLDSAVRLATMLGIGCAQLPKPLNIGDLRRMLMTKMPDQPLVQSVSTTVQAIAASELASALDRDEIVPWFQPKVELATGKVVGCEALARWQHAALGMIPADVFVPLAEASGLMTRLTDRLLHASTRAMRAIVEDNPGFSIAVNVSASLLSDLSLADRIDGALAGSGLPPGALTVEITESAAMSDIVKATDILVGLRVKGVGVAIDDFGTGYSSLAALARMPFSELKIDKLFVSDRERNRDMMRVVRACVRLGHELDMKVVAEGVETVADWNGLHECGCDIGQGFTFAPALDATHFAAWMEQWRHRGDLPHLSPSAVA